MTDKQIIIGGKKENCKILFDCFHVDELKAFKMIKDGIKITPENTPVDDFELRLVSYEENPYGFMSICKRKRNTDEWEYNGLGHTGAASIITALLKQLKTKEQECEGLKKIIDEARNSKLDLKSFLVGEAIQREYEQRPDQLKAENEELKKDYTTAKSMYDLCESDFMELAKIKDKYKQTLTEIKEIAETAVKQHYATISEDYTKGYNWLGSIILQKISEVIDER